MTRNPFKTLDSRMLWHSNWYALREDHVRFPDGSEGPYTVIEKAPSVYVVPVTDDGMVVLIRNFRYTLNQWLWEVPAGGLQPGFTLEQMAAKELREEVGGTAREFQPVGSFYTMPGIGTEQAHVFLARGVELGEPDLEPAEIIERHPKPVAEVVRMAQTNEMQDGLSALAVLLCVPYFGHYIVR